MFLRSVSPSDSTAHVPHVQPYNPESQIFCPTHPRQQLSAFSQYHPFNACGRRPNTAFWLNPGVNFLADAIDAWIRYPWLLVTWVPIPLCFQQNFQLRACWSHSSNKHWKQIDQHRLYLIDSQSKDPLRGTYAMSQELESLCDKRKPVAKCTHIMKKRKRGLEKCNDRLTLKESHKVSVSNGQLLYQEGWGQVATEVLTELFSDPHEMYPLSATDRPTKFCMYHRSQ